MINLDDFRPWVQFLKPEHQRWFGLVLNHIINNGFQLHETRSADINCGSVLGFRNGDCHIDVSRVMETCEYGNRPGIRLMNEMKAYEISISVNAPTDIVRLAIAQLHNEDI
jgi:hypothetical protein